MKKEREDGSRSSGPATSTVLPARSAGGPASRGPSISPSPCRKPSASSSSWPGVRIVTASGRAVDADLQRLLDRDLVLEAVVDDGGVRAADADVGHGWRGARICSRIASNAGCASSSRSVTGTSTAPRSSSARARVSSRCAMWSEWAASAAAASPASIAS